MHKKTAIAVLLALAASLSGCIIRTRPAPRARSCPPNHHWENGACVHDHRGPVIRDHR